MLGCPEEVAYKNAWITKDCLLASVQKYSKSDYGKYLSKLLI
jgi:dTDP-glucose pyrophosphorylase